MCSTTDILETGAAWITEAELEGLGKHISELEANLKKMELLAWENRVDAARLRACLKQAEELIRDSYLSCSDSKEWGSEAKELLAELKEGE